MLQHISSGVMEVSTTLKRYRIQGNTSKQCTVSTGDWQGAQNEHSTHTAEAAEQSSTVDGESCKHPRGTLQRAMETKICKSYSAHLPWPAEKGRNRSAPLRSCGVREKGSQSQHIPGW